MILLIWTAAQAQVTPSQDSFTNSADATTNYGANVLLDVDGAKEITYIQFNLASIPSGASVSQATLKLYVNAVTTAGSFNVDYVTGPWEESALDANDAPPLGASIASSVSITTADKNQYILINVTSALQAWLSGSEANDGLALVANGTFNASFDSKESKTTSHPPELDVVFAGSGNGITGIDTASGSGLIGGGTSGTLNLSLTNTCAMSQVLQWNGTSWLCASVGTGTITGVIAGTDLTGGGTSGNVTLNLNTSATNALYAQLATANTFSGVQTINNTTLITGANSSGVLEVTNTLSSGSAPAVVGTTNSTNASGLKGIASATSGTSNGVYGTNSSEGGFGVKGASPNVGVYGAADGASNTGSDFATLSGVWGDTGSAGESGVLGTADDNIAGLFINNSTFTPSLYVENNGTTGTAFVFQTNGSNFGGACDIDVKGDLACTGKVSSVAKVDGGAREVSLFAMQSAENWFEDFGSATLANGMATVALDPTFAQTVNTAMEYHVFVTPNGDCKGLYISKKSAGSFEVRELAAGESNVNFDYRIVARRQGFENVRLTDVTEQYQKMEQQQQTRRKRIAQRRTAHH
ncbi:MAG: DNRLRE domain-containing protein [Terriglobales bacterium]